MISRKLPHKFQQLKQHITVNIDFNHITHTVNKFNQKKIESKLKQHQKKLWDLGVNQMKIDPEKIIFNFQFFQTNLNESRERSFST